MKDFLLGAWICAAVIIAIGYAIVGINIGMVMLWAATFAGWAVLVFAGRAK